MISTDNVSQYDIDVENPTLFTAHTRPGNGEVEYTYAETDHLLTRRHWMTDEQMKEYEATPVTYPTLQMLHDAMLQSWGLRKEDLIVKEVKYEDVNRSHIS